MRILKSLGLLSLLATVGCSTTTWGGADGPGGSFLWSPMLRITFFADLGFWLLVAALLFRTFKRETSGWSSLQLSALMVAVPLGVLLLLNLGPRFLPTDRFILDAEVLSHERHTLFDETSEQLLWSDVERCVHYKRQYEYTKEWASGMSESVRARYESLELYGRDGTRWSFPLEDQEGYVWRWVFDGDPRVPAKHREALLAALESRIPVRCFPLTGSSPDPIATNPGRIEAW